MGRSQRHKVRFQGVAADGEAVAEGMGVANASGVTYSSTGVPINNKPVDGTPPYIVAGNVGGPLQGSLVLGGGPTAQPKGDPVVEEMQK